MSALSGQRALVTGAGGFIGSHLVDALVADGVEVRALVHYNARDDWGNLELLPAEVRGAVEVISGDIQDPFSVAKAVAGCEVVFHLAALIGIPYSYRAPRSYVDTNILGTINVLEAAREGVRRIVHTSTSETYGTATYTPIDEAHPLQAQSPYAATKMGADKLAESYARSFGTPVATLRPFNTFGPRQSLRAVIPTIAAQALAGGEVRLGALDPVRDFTYAGDTARAFIALATAGPEVEGEVFNAGNGKGITIGELAETIIDLVGTPAQIVAEEVRMRPEQSEVRELLADSTRLREATGWAPATGLREGLGLTIDWLRTAGTRRADRFTE